MRRRIPQIICGAMGALLFILHFLEHPDAKSAYLMLINEYWQILFAFALLVGVVSFVKNNLKGIERGNDRLNRVVTLLGFLSMPVLALIWGIKGGTPFMWMFDNVQAPMQATVFALLAFYVASASFRGFRARSIPAAVLLISALLTLLSRSDIGSLLHDSVPQFADWVRNNPSMSARRAILIGIGLGSLTTSLRVILGIERTWLGGRTR